MKTISQIMSMPDSTIGRILETTCKIGFWIFIQLLIAFACPCLSDYAFNTRSVVLIVLYTFLFTLYFRIVPGNRRMRYLICPYLLYSLITLLLPAGEFKVSGLLSASTLTMDLILPLYGASLFVVFCLIRRGMKCLFGNTRLLKLLVFIGICFIFAGLRYAIIKWRSANQGSFESEKRDIIERRAYLVKKIITDPQKLLNEMPSFIGPQYCGEWALYSCSMLSAALTNISYLYPETKKENIDLSGKLVELALLPEIRQYDTDRWDEDALHSLGGDNSHVSYLSHLAWMIGNYKCLSHDDYYDGLYHEICEAMNRRIRRSKNFNLPTYPGESIYIPDMLVAVVALNQYSKMYGGKYQNTVDTWIRKARTVWKDKSTKLLTSYLGEGGCYPIRGSYSALNCYYLSLIDPSFAKEQYEGLKTCFWKEGMVSGFREFTGDDCKWGIDIDSGPIINGLSPSGTAFALGAATFFDDEPIRKEILRTAEVAGITFVKNGQRHYLLSNVALVGEAIMLAMRTNVPSGK